MKIERDDESTSFEARPWGGQQRLIPLANRFARDPNAPAPAPAEVVRPVRPAARPAQTTRPAQAARPAQRKVAAGTIAPQSAAAPTVALRIPQPAAALDVAHNHVAPSVAAPTVALRVQQPNHAAPTVVIDIPALSTDQQSGLPTDVEVAAIPSVHGAAYVSAPVVSSSMPVMPGAVPAFSVKYGCSLGGFVMPHIPKIAQRFVDQTAGVRRRFLSRRSMIAAPLGAGIAGVVIAILCLAHPSVAAERSAASVHVQMPNVVTMSTVVSMPVVAAPVAAAPVVAEPVAAAAPAPAAVEPAHAPDATHTAPDARPHAHASHSHHRPRKIIAVDATTPLGNLRNDLMVP